MTTLPWKKNEQLIKALYEKVQVLEAVLNALKTEYEKLALLNQLKSEIATKVFTDLKPILSKELTEDIVDSLFRRITGFKQGVV